MSPPSTPPPEYKIGDLLQIKGVWGPATVISKKLVMSSWAGAYNIFEYDIMLPDGTIKSCTQRHPKDAATCGKISKQQ
jgi:hypothetical protein